MTKDDAFGDRSYIKRVMGALIAQSLAEGTEAFNAEMVRRLRGKIGDELLQSWCRNRGIDPDKIV
jgi:hypothetical protein